MTAHELIEHISGADAIYAAVAVQSGCTLISLDNEHLTWLVGIVPVLTPATVLANQTLTP
jgi:hypothetical protein